MIVKSILKNKQFLSLAGNVTMALLNIAASAILYRYMSKPEVGYWFLFQVVFTLTDTFRTGFLQTAFIKFYAGADEQRAENVLGSTWYLGILITIVVLLINLSGLFLLPFIQDPGTLIILKWTGITFVFTLPIVVCTWLLQAQQRYREILYIRLINQLSFIILVLLYLYFHVISLNLVLMANLLSCVLTCLVIFVLRWTGIKTLTKRTVYTAKEIFHFGKFSIGTSISSNLLRSSDVFIINFMLGPASVAVYSLAQSLMNIIDIPVRSFTATALPSLAAAQNNNRVHEVENIFKKYAGVLTIVFIPVAIAAILFAGVAVSLIGGGKYTATPGANIFRIFMTFAIFFSLDKFTGVTLDVIHKPKLNFYKVLIMLGVNVAGDFTGIYYCHNIYGVALASIPTFIIGTVFGYLFLKRYLNFGFFEIITSGYRETVSLAKTALRR